jgi:cell division protein FtsL
MKLKALDRIKPGAAEVAANPRSRSAIMRVAERTAGMTRLNLVLLLAVLASALYLVRTQYESRRLFTEIDRAQQPRRAAWKPRHERLQVEKRAQATPLPRGKLAREQLQMRTATPAITQYVQRRPSCRPLRLRRGPAMSSRSVLYTSSPLLASKTPVWRSKFIVAAIALGFAGLAARAAWVQVFGNDFLPASQGEVRFARTLELPANRGRILDRNGLMLATSVPAPSIWAIPEDVDATTRACSAELARLLGMPLAELNSASWPTRTRPLSGSSARSTRRGPADRRAGHQGHLPAQGIPAQVPRGRGGGACGGLHQRGGQGPGGRGAGLQQRAGRPRRARAASSRTAWAAWSRTWASRCRRSTAATCSCPSTARCSSLPTRSCAMRFIANKAKAGSVVVLDADHRRGAGAGQLPELCARTGART